MIALNNSSLLCDGDLIFIRSGSYLYQKVADMTRTWTSHVGVLFGGEHGEWMVAESRVPKVVYTPLETFLSRSVSRRFAVERLRQGLETDAIKELRQAANKRMGRRYDLGFDYDARGEFCSKFAHEIYLEALGVEIGKVETFREVVEKGSGVPLWFWRLWFLGSIPWERRTVTPASIFQSPLLQAIIQPTTLQSDPKQATPCHWPRLLKALPLRTPAVETPKTLSTPS